MTAIQQVQLVEAESCHDLALKEVIQSVGREYGAIGEGFGPSDPEVLAMSQHYGKAQKSLYLVALLEGQVIGGCGIAQFGEHSDICELKKLFLLSEARGKRVGYQLVQACLEFAKQQGYQSCYLDTLTTMQSAIQLYIKFGFYHLDQPYPGTTHNGCDVWMMKSLTD
ncbi:GNAT family N-acetyltransferase [Vibrio hippocampi]|uniref:N-acetyltransferase domain-containing protein n=1 Tax=Vibrio hippocampi TaxID=654686 RepID=A0ABM8ZNN0_9VIBR|nr:GNAT family N-acetyltransferase [Vibrio hippocampi]CAH0530093.1 hypothetical protein VHP8226_03821 [Vibrio hippocampi]